MARPILADQAAVRQRLHSNQRREAYSSLDELLIVLASLSGDAALVASSNRVELGGGHSGREHLDSCSVRGREREQKEDR